MFIPFLAAIGMSRSMSGGVSSGGGTTRSGAGSPTSLMNPSNRNGWKPIRAVPPSGGSAMNVWGTPWGQTQTNQQARTVEHHPYRR
jgi:hypothetical protein